MQRHAALEEVIVPVVEGLGYTFVGLQYLPHGRQMLLRLFIDKPAGVTIDDCEKVSRQVDAVMEVKAPIEGQYILEVSSPGLDRLLFTRKQFEEQIGKTIAVRMIAPIKGRRNFKGILEAAGSTEITLRMEDETVLLAFIDITEARLVPEW